MVPLDILYSLKDLLFAGFREPSLLWQITPVILLWVILVFYFATHKEEKLGWNTSLANGISLFWVVLSGMQYIFSNNKQFFTWTKFSIFIFILIYASFIIYTTFKHLFSARIAYAVASHNIVYYLSVLALIYAYDMIYLSLSMFIAIFLIFGFILLIELILKKILPEMKEDDFPLSDESSFADFDSDSKQFDLNKESSPGGIEKQMGGNNMSDNDISFE